MSNLTLKEFEKAVMRFTEGLPPKPVIWFSPLMATGVVGFKGPLVNEALCCHEQEEGYILNEECRAVLPEELYCYELSSEDLVHRCRKRFLRWFERKHDTPWRGFTRPFRLLEYWERT